MAAIGRGPAWLRYLLKPGTMVLIIAWAAGRSTWTDSYDRLILLGLLLSLAGDVFLMLPSERFVSGLASFLLAHVMYVLAFAVSGTRPWSSSGLAVGLGLAVVAAAVFLRLQPGVLAADGPRLVAPVAVYVAAISLMVWRALLLGRPAVVAGALLFYLSDFLLAWNRFVRPFHWADQAVMTTYYAAQYLIASSVA